jgi:transposase
VTFEEGAWAAWLYDLRKPHVANLVVCTPRKNALLKHGNKSDKIDARKLANLLRLNGLEPVYHGESGVRMLRELARSYLTIVKDVSRVMTRLKAIYRSWAIPSGRDVYYTRHGSEWLGKIPEAGTRRRAEQLYQQLDLLQPCASKPGANCWRRVASILSLPNCGRSPPWGRFARLWRWLRHP